MKELYSVLPPFAPDYSGVASVFFGLGGSIVINGADGCIGNVTGYDEPRFYRSDEMIFSTGLREIHAITGDEKFILDRLKKENPKYVVLLSTPTSAIIGTDHKALSDTIEEKMGIPAYDFSTTGMNTYEKGASKALLTIAKKMLKPVDYKKNRSINIIGMIPLDYWNEPQLRCIEDIFKRRDIEINSCWTMGGSLKDIESSLKAQCNLVVSVAGIEAARYMKAKYDIDYVIGVPFGGPYEEWIVNKLLKGDDEYSYSKELVKKSSKKGRILIIGDQIWANSLREAIELEYNVEVVKVVSLFKMYSKLKRKCDRFIQSEEELESEMNENFYDLIIGDPIFKTFISEINNIEYCDVPHLAVSSRIHWDHNIYYIGEEGMDRIRKILD
ncbi:nitrogenase component 1 [Wukongibacter sp. M2B1]|uniref:nitrogenase component 1 n=1 Tax=Wukongibacter sp. M2B1 TaxID=3088895 RepID=UPI003D7B7D74